MSCTEIEQYTRPQGNSAWKSSDGTKGKNRTRHKLYDSKQSNMRSPYNAKNNLIRNYRNLESTYRQNSSNLVTSLLLQIANPYK